MAPSLGFNRICAALLAFPAMHEMARASRSAIPDFQVQVIHLHLTNLLPRASRCCSRLCRSIRFMKLSCSSTGASTIATTADGSVRSAVKVLRSCCTCICRSLMRKAKKIQAPLSHGFARNSVSVVLEISAYSTKLTTPVTLAIERLGCGLLGRSDDSAHLVTHFVSQTESMC